MVGVEDDSTQGRLQHKVVRAVGAVECSTIVWILPPLTGWPGLQDLVVRGAPQPLLRLLMVVTEVMEETLYLAPGLPLEGTARWAALQGHRRRPVVVVRATSFLVLEGSLFLPVPARREEMGPVAAVQTGPVSARLVVDRGKARRVEGLVVESRLREPPLTGRPVVRPRLVLVVVRLGSVMRPDQGPTVVTAQHLRQEPLAVVGVEVATVAPEVLVVMEGTALGEEGAVVEGHLMVLPAVREVPVATAGFELKPRVQIE